MRTADGTGMTRRRVRLLAPRHVGALLGVSTSRVQQFDREGRLPALRDSLNRRLYDEASVLRFKAERDRQRGKA